MSKRSNARLYGKRDGFVVSKSGRTAGHKVGRAALTEPPPDAKVIDFTTPASTEAFLRKTGHWEQLTSTGEVTIRNGDLAAMELLLRNWGELAEQARRGRAEVERQWLLQRRAEMEDELATFGHPRDAWRELSLIRLTPERVDDPKDSCLLLEPWQHKGLTQRFLADPDGDITKRVLWAIGVARICTEALEAPTSEARLLLGRLLERFENWRRSPNELSAQEAMRNVQRAAREARQKGARAAAKARHDAYVSDKVEPLRADYLAGLKAGASSSEVIRALAAKHGYKRRTIRRIIQPTALRKRL